MDELAIKDFGVEDFSSMLRWAMREEAAEAAAQARRSRRNWSRKKARLRCAALPPSCWLEREAGWLWKGMHAAQPACTAGCCCRAGCQPPPPAQPACLPA